MRFTRWQTGARPPLVGGHECTQTHLIQEIVAQLHVRATFIAPKQYRNQLVILRDQGLDGELQLTTTVY